MFLNDVMKSYCISAQKNKLLMSAVLFSTLLTACHPGYILPGKVNTICRSSLIHLANSGHLLILPIETPDMAPDLSFKVAELFNAEIQKINYFRQVSLVEDPALLSEEFSEADKIERALYLAHEKMADAVLLGTVKEYLISISSDNRITMNVMILDVKTGKKLWWGERTTIGKPGNTYFLFDNRSSGDTPAVDKLLHHTVQKIVKRIFTN